MNEGCSVQDSNGMVTEQFCKLRTDQVIEKFNQINVKLDKLTELAEQTHLQEYRIEQIERKLLRMESERGSVLWKFLTPVISAAVSAVMAFIIAGGLVK